MRSVNEMNVNEAKQLPSASELTYGPGSVMARQQALPERSEVRYFVEAFRRQKRFIVVVAGLCFVVIAGALLLVTPVYESTARVVIDPPGSEAFSLQAVNQGLSEPDYVETQAHVLRSEGLAIDTVRALKLDTNPVVMKKGFVASLKSSRLVQSVLGALGRSKHHAEHVQDDTHLSESEVAALDYFQNHLTISPVKNSRVIEVSFKSPDPELSASVPNTLVNQYIVENYAKRYDAVMKSSEWLSRQLDDIRAKAVAANEALASYQREYGIAEVDDRQNNLSERESELIRQYTQAQADRIQYESYMIRVRQGDVASVPQFRNNIVVLQTTQKLGELQGQLSQAQVSYGDNHPVVTRLNNEIAELRRQLKSQEQGTANEIRASFAAANAREHQLSEEMKSTTLQMSQMSRYAILKREAQANHDLYDALYARVKEAGISAASKSSNITVVDKARALDHPTWPRLSLMLPIAFLVSWIGAVSAGVARDSIDHSIRSADDVSLLPGTQSLVLVPDFQQKKQTLPSFAVGKCRLRVGGGPEPIRTGLNKFMLARQDSPEAESLRSLLSTVLLAHRQMNLKALLVTSPFPQEGKTTLAYNFALALAARGRTCFLNADLRKGGSPLESGRRDYPGISDFCKGGASLEEIEIPSGERKDLAVVHAGTCVENASHILMSDAFQYLMTNLRDRYDFVVVDSPPILPFADTRFLAVLCDGAVLIARAGVTDRKSFEQSAELLAQLAVPVLGIALNGVPSKEYPYRGYYAGAEAR